MEFGLCRAVEDLGTGFEAFGAWEAIGLVGVI